MDVKTRIGPRHEPHTPDGRDDFRRPILGKKKFGTGWNPSLPDSMRDLHSLLRLIALAAFGLVAADSSADTVNAVWNSPADVPVTANGYGGAGNTVNFT